MSEPDNEPSGSTPAASTKVAALNCPKQSIQCLRGTRMQNPVMYIYLMCASILTMLRWMVRILNGLNHSSRANGSREAGHYKNYWLRVPLYSSTRTGWNSGLRKASRIKWSPSREFDICSTSKQLALHKSFPGRRNERPRELRILHTVLWVFSVSTCPSCTARVHRRHSLDCKSWYSRYSQTTASSPGRQA